MVAKSQLSVMNFNSGVNRKQLTVKTGDLRYKQSYSKVTQNCLVKKIADQKHRNYLPNLVENRSQTTLPADITVNIASVEKPDKKEAIRQMKTRFSF